MSPRSRAAATPLIPGADSEGEAQEWTEHCLEPLSNHPYYKLRAGDYRAIITWARDEDVMIVEAVGHRRNVYDRHLPP